MKASELRIMNLVNYYNWNNDSKDCFFYVRDLFFEGDKIGLTNLKIQTKVDFKYIKPIPLTEERVLSIGFIKSETIANEYDDADSWISLRCVRGLWYLCSNDGNMNAIPLDYVHELQNLYYALRKKELIIKKI